MRQREFLLRHLIEMKLDPKNQAVLELILAGVFWGLGFIATVWALETLSPSAVNFYRFFIAALFGLPMVLLFGGGVRKGVESLWNELKGSWIAGFLLSLLLMPQTLGLMTTTPSKSAFITILYVLFVPFLARLFLKEVLPWKIYFIIPWAVLGVGLMVHLRWDEWAEGDSWTLLCSFFAAVHILYVAIKARTVKDIFFFSVGQSFWTAVFCALLSLLFPIFNEGSWNLLAINEKGLWGMAILTLGSSFLAFLLMVRAQRHLSPTVASVLFLLESPFSALFSFLLIGETLSLMQLSGAALILLSCILIKSAH